MAIFHDANSRQWQNKPIELRSYQVTNDLTYFYFFLPLVPFGVAGRLKI